MNDEQNLHEEAEDLRKQTADGAPEVAEHDELEMLRKAVEEANSKALYAAAEVQNVRRRLEGEKQQAATYAATGFARDMLSIRDHLDRAIAHLPPGAHDGELKGFVEGMEATLRELDAAFARNGVERVAAKGLPLDPNKHQAMLEVPTNDAAPGTIVEEMQAGYEMKGRLLRPALVGVAKAP